MFGLVPFTRNISKNNSDFSDLFDVFNEPFFHNGFTPNFMKSFKVDVKESDTGYELTAELAGIKKENISLDYNKGYLTIKTIEKKEVDEDDKYLRRERYIGEMKRSFYIDGIDEQKIKASYKDGILTVDLPKKTEKEISTQIDID